MLSKNINILQIFFLVTFSFFINKYYANFGVEPMDTFVLYNGGYKVLNGLTPFLDYWLTTGPLMDYFNAFFFFIGGVSWNTYTIHSSLFNVVITVSTYLFLKNLGLNNFYSTIYSLMFAALMYPVVGTPFVDHHAIIFLLLSFYLFIIGIKKQKFKLFIYIPSILAIGFLCKQTPTSYGIIVIFILGLAAFIFSKNKKDMVLNTSLGLVIALLLLFIFFFFSKIPINNFFQQYIIYGSSIGSYRLREFNPDLIGIAHQYKFIFVPLITSALIFFSSQLKKDLNETLIFISIISLTLILLFHQLLTLNENFIFFLIPILTAFNHFYISKYFSKKIIIKYFLIAICVFSVLKYHERFNEKRKFHTLEFVDLDLAIDASTIDKSLSGLKWITRGYKKNPSFELSEIKKSISILSEEQDKYMLITNYLFLSSILKTNDYSPNQWHHPDVSFPIKGRKDFFIYKKFFTDKLLKNDISKIYTIGDDLKIYLSLLYKKECFSKMKLGDIIYKYEIKKDCKDLYEFS